MSIKNKTTLTSILSVALIASIFYYSSTKKNKELNRNILLSTFTADGVVNRSIQIDFAADQVDSESETAEVYVNLSLPFDFDADLNYTWKLSEGVSLMSGDLKGQLKGLKKDEPHKVLILVKGFSKKINRQIGFEVYGIKNGRKVYGDIVIASDKENTFEDIVQNVEKIKASE